MGSGVGSEIIEPFSANGLGNGWGDAENTAEYKEPLCGAWADRARVAGAQGCLAQHRQTVWYIQIPPGTLTQQVGSRVHF